MTVEAFDFSDLNIDQSIEFEQCMTDYLPRWMSGDGEGIRAKGPDLYIYSQMWAL